MGVGESLFEDGLSQLICWSRRALAALSSSPPSGPVQSVGVVKAARQGTRRAWPWELRVTVLPRSILLVEKKG